jgi:hypothetical protein
LRRPDHRQTIRLEQRITIVNWPPPRNIGRQGTNPEWSNVAAKGRARVGADASVRYLGHSISGVDEMAVF